LVRAEVAEALLPLEQRLLAAISAALPQRSAADPPPSQPRALSARAPAEGYQQGEFPRSPPAFSSPHSRPSVRALLTGAASIPAAVSARLQPYLACTLSAEVGKWLRHVGAPCSFYVDDFTFVAPSLRDMDALLDKAVNLLNLVGLYCDPSKTEKGQQLIILGLLHDSTRMQLRVDPTAALSAELYLEYLRSRLQDVRSGKRPAASLASSQLASLTGKLNWFCEVLQSRIRGFTKLLQYGPSLHSTDWAYLTTGCCGRGRSAPICG